MQDDVGMPLKGAEHEAQPKGDQNGGGWLEGEQRDTPSYANKSSQEDQIGI